jgi:hypothetical protein
LSGAGLLPSLRNAGRLPQPGDLVLPSLRAYQPTMAKRVKLLPQERGTVLFDVVFEDGSRASNRRVPMEILGGLDGDQPARQLIEQQEAEIAHKAGRPPRAIQSLTRAAKSELKPTRE